MCLYPTFRKNPKYKINKKNGGNVPVMHDDRVKYVPTGCGNCIECRKQKARNWQLRMLEEVKTETNGKFVTLTFSEESIHEIATKYGYYELKGYTFDNAVATKAVRLFLERWRKEFKKSVKHWLITELGHEGTERIHLHGMIWTDEPISKIREKWNYGYIYPRKDDDKNWVNEQTVNYVMKYVTKIDPKHKEYKPKILCSQGIGKNYVNTQNFKRHKYDGEETVTTYKTKTGHDIALPIYWRNKAFTEEEREKLWLYQLDKGKRYVMGEEIDVTTDEGMNDYWQTLKYYQNKNTVLGFGNNEIDWNRRKYESELRELKKLERQNKMNGKPSRGGGLR